MKPILARIAALDRRPWFVFLSCLGLTFLVALALLFFSQFGTGATNVIYGEF